MKKTKYLLLLIIAIAGCAKDSSETPDLSTGKAQLIAPVNNSLCIEGIITGLSGSEVKFSWESSLNTDQYSMKLTNLLTKSETVYSTSKLELKVILAVNTPYTWSIRSKNTKTLKSQESEIWKFYNSGPGASSYSPFPAQIIFPVRDQLVIPSEGRTDLHWKGSDVDGDILFYTIYFGTSPTPTLFKDNVVATSLSQIPVEQKSIYYWKVITTDSKGNASDSGIYMFKTI